VNPRRVAVFALAALMAIGAGAYALFMLGVIHIDLRPWMNRYPDGHARFFTFMDRAGVRATEASQFGGGSFTGALFIGDPANLEDLDLVEPESGAATLIIMPRYPDEGLSEVVGRPKKERRFELLGRTYIRGNEDEFLTSWEHAGGETLPLDPTLELLTFKPDPGPSLLIEAGSYGGYRILLFRGINAADNEQLSSEGALHLLYETLSGSMPEGTWVTYFDPGRYGQDTRIAAAQPLAVLFSGPLLAVSLSVIAALALAAWHAAVRLGPPDLPPPPRARMLETMLTNTAGFWLRFAGPAAADQADLDRFWSDVRSVTGRSFGSKSEFLTEHPQFADLSALFEPVVDRVNVRTIQRRIRMRNELIEKLTSQENTNGYNP
jgi:hypothetical protein